MHFLQPARFLNTPDLAGRKVNVLYDPGLSDRPPPYDFDAGQRHYLGNWKARALKISTFFWAKWKLAALVAISGPKKVEIFRARPFQLPA